ncbi:MAG: hypothetical protein ABII97_00920 [Patescibacteria group bacterium]
MILKSTVKELTDKPKTIEITARSGNKITVDISDKACGEYQISGQKLKHGDILQNRRREKRKLQGVGLSTEGWRVMGGETVLWVTKNNFLENATFILVKDKKNGLEAEGYSLVK